MPKPYRVVKFPDEQDSLAVVPTSWLTQNDELCFWPHGVRGSEVITMIENKVAPQQDWGRYPVVVMARCSTYDKATRRVKRAEAVSGVDTTEQSGVPGLWSGVEFKLRRLLPAFLEELEAAEAAVGDEAVAATLRKHLLRIGGNSLREVAANAMKAVMAHPVQVLYSLYGRKGKRAFVNLKLCRIVTDVVCEKGHVDVVAAQSFIKKWLPGSVDRGGGRKRRFTETFAAEEPNDSCPRDRNHCLTPAALSLPHPGPQSPGLFTDPSCPAASPAEVQFCTRPAAM
ncbi:uncharacterized protein [Dermacentor albipictus]|uniref:uncharacterized protein n=1 Tax=Dermacentor albipictus TaxID=60249 RepID=UPI0031FBF15C